MKRLITAVRNAKRVYLCGNGGSAANACHIANDLVSVGVDARALLDVATLTAIANDFGYEQVFARQLMACSKPGELLIALSGSGESSNILKAIRRAKARGLVVWAIVGAYHLQPSGAQRHAHFCIARGRDMQEAEEAQIGIGHALMRALKRRQSCE